MNFKKNIIGLLTAGLFLSTSAMAARPGDGELILSVFGLANQSKEQASSSESKDSYNYGGGGLVEANINGVVGIETGALFVKRQYEYSALGSTLVQEVSRFHIPVMAKFWPTNFLSLGVGPYMSVKTGSVKNSLNIGGVDVGSVDTNADDDVEFGLDIAAAVTASLSDKTGLFLEARYSKPFKEEDSVDYESLTALAGVKISL